MRRISIAYLTWSSRVTETLAAGLLLFIVGLNLLAVFFRFVLVSPIGWTEEAMRYSIVWATYLASAAALYRGEHMVLDLTSKLGSPVLRRALHVAALLGIAGFCTVIVVTGYPVALNNARQVSPVMNVSMLWPYVAVPFGCSLMLVKAVILIFVDPLPEERGDANGVQADLGDDV